MRSIRPDQQGLRGPSGHVSDATLTRRRFASALARLGIAGPLAARVLALPGAAAAPAAAPAGQPSAPNRRGGGGRLRLLWWQGPTQLNPHFATGAKDSDAARLFYEPLAAVDPEGNLVPILAAEIPTLENAGVARDGTAVTWRLKRGVAWHDGSPFSADDVVFNWEYVADPATASTAVGIFSDVKRVEKLDAHTVRIVFHAPVPAWRRAFVGVTGLILPRHLFDAYRGARSREARWNLEPVGTGPYRFVDFKPGDLLHAEINRDYHEPGRPHFDTVEMKGGGDAASAARAVLQTGDFDYAWNVAVEDELLRRFERGGKGRVVFAPGGRVEHIVLNMADPWTEVDGERSSPKSRHPLFSDPAVRQALSLLVDRAAIERHIYGRLGAATANFLNNPARYRSPNTTWEFSIDKANGILDAAGWKRGADGIRAKDGRKLTLVFQTTISNPRQKVQQVVKSACAKAGIGMELKAVVASVFFSSDVANPDTHARFQADLTMFNIGSGTDPWYFMNQYVSAEVASKANKWQGRNLSRWRNEAYDRLYAEAGTELDPAKRAALFVRMNDLIVQNHVVIPLLSTPEHGAASNRLRMTLSGWDSALAFVKDWVREP